MLFFYLSEFVFIMPPVPSLSQKARKSPVWEFMELISPSVAKCSLCQSTLTYCKTTSNLMKHLVTKHPLEYAERHGGDPAMPVTSTTSTVSTPSTSSEGTTTSAAPSVFRPSQRTLQEVLAKKDGYKEGGAKKKHLDDLLLGLITTDMQQMSIVEDKGFRSFVLGLDPRYTLPSRREITRKLLPTKYELARKELYDELQETPYLALTTDIWSSRQTRGYITVTIHYITSEWVLKSSVLETARLTKDHTAENIATELTDICNKWDILDKVSCIVTDSGANIVAAVAKCMQKKQLPCFAHLLNLVVQDFIKNSDELKEVLDKVKKLVSYFHHSVKATDKLAQVQDQHDVTRKKLVMDVETRWNSTYFMLKSVLEQHEVITTTLCLMSKNTMCLTQEEIDCMRNAIALLGPFEQVTREMSGEKFTSLSKVIPIIRNLQAYINTKTAGQVEENGMAKEVQRQLYRRFNKVEQMFHMVTATFLDPRFKKMPFADINNVKAVEERLVQMMRASYSGEENRQAQAVAEEAEEEDDPEEMRPADDFQLWENFDRRVKTCQKTALAPVSGPHIEMRRYEEEPLISRKEDPLVWWKNHGALFPKLQNYAKKFLCIPATSVPAERLFSKAGELISQRRSSLGDDTINMILFLNKNQSISS